MPRRSVLGLAVFLLACSGSSDDGGSTSSGGAGGSGASGGSGTGATGATGTGATGTGATGGGGTGASSGTGGASGGGGMAGTNTGGSAGAGGCPLGCSDNPGFICCGGHCVNPKNDINNCSSCGTQCSGANPFCDQGTCGTAPCTNPSACVVNGSCCGTTCCGAGELCCDVPGPVGSKLECSKPTDSGTCPPGCTGCKCTSPDTPIATPSGDRPMAALRVGDLVYSVDRGVQRAVPVSAVHRVRADHHSVMRVRLASGVVLEVSPAHPTADGRTFGSLRRGDFLDGLEVEGAALVPYRHDYTYDILPDSDSHAYYAGGVLIGSTLGPTPSAASQASAPLSATSPQ